MVEPGGDAFIEQARGRVARHVFRDVGKPPTRGQNHEQPDGEVQPQITFRRKARLEETLPLPETARRRFIHLSSFLPAPRFTTMIIAMESFRRASLMPVRPEK